MNWSSTSHNALFADGRASDAIRGQVHTAVKEAQGLTQDRLLNTDEQELVEYFVKKYRVEIPKLDKDNIRAEQHERQVEVYDQFDQRSLKVPGVAYDFVVPFEGEEDIFKLQPSTFGSAPPHARVVGNTLQFTISGRELSAEKVKGQFDSLLRSVEQYLSWHEETWSGLENNVRTEVGNAIRQRRQRLLEQQSTAAELSSLGIKLAEKPDDPRTYVSPKVKTKIQPKMPPMKEASPPEPTLASEHYNVILGLIRDAGRSIEQSSSRMRELDEETLRDMFLVPLNAHFGSAKGEAFNYGGKTDILIQHDGSNIFVSEFKIWSGEKNFASAIDQLLSYLSWRDTKTAMVVFSRNEGFTNVLSKMKSVVLAHKNYVDGPKKLSDTSNQFVFSLPQDADRRVIISTLAFDLGTVGK